MNAADELERMAREFDAKATEHSQLAVDMDRRGSLTSSYVEDGVSGGYERAAMRLRARAAEIRQQRSGSTIKPQPKPSAVTLDQWWAYEWNDGAAALSPFRVARTCGATRIAADIGIRCSASVDDMLTNPRWLYLGNGERPDFGGSEVAGEEER